MQETNQHFLFVEETEKESNASCCEEYMKDITCLFSNYQSKLNLKKMHGPPAIDLEKGDRKENAAAK
jgi:hypothetical protein